MRFADLPGLRRFDGGCGSFRLPDRSRHQLPLDLRYLRLRFCNQALGQAVRLQLKAIAFSSEVAAGSRKENASKQEALPEWGKLFRLDLAPLPVTMPPDNAARAVMAGLVPAIHALLF